MTDITIPVHQIEHRWLKAEIGEKSNVYFVERLMPSFAQTTESGESWLSFHAAMKPDINSRAIDTAFSTGKVFPLASPDDVEAWVEASVKETSGSAQRVLYALAGAAAGMIFGVAVKVVSAMTAPTLDLSIDVPTVVAIAAVSVVGGVVGALAFGGFAETEVRKFRKQNQRHIDAHRADFEKRAAGTGAHA